MSVASAPNSDIPPSAATRLHYIDGVRACAMLSVLFYHAWHLGGKWPLAINVLHHKLPLAYVLMLGHSGVNLFLVLTGFCLFWPFATKPDRKFDLQNFAMRRSWRILPPYYGALALSVLVMFLTYIFAAGPPVKSNIGTDILWHVLMVYNFNPNYFLTINPVFWSLALEYHLYFLFPLFLLLFRRFPARTIVYTALILQMIIRFTLSHFFHHASLSLSFVIFYGFWGRFFEFILGMYVAYLIAGWQKTKKLELNAVDYAAAAIVFVIGVLGLRGATANSLGEAWFRPMMDILFGLFAAVFILLASQQGSLLNRILSHKFMVHLGIISYSVYLVHMLFVRTISNWADQHNLLGTTVMMGIDLLVVIPVCLLGGYLYHQAVERHFLRLPEPKTVAKTVPVA